MSARTRLLVDALLALSAAGVLLVASLGWADPAGARASGGACRKGGVCLAGKFRAADGSAATPAYSFISDTDTGFYRAGANQLGISVGAARSFVFIGTPGYLEGDASTVSLQLRAAAGTWLTSGATNIGIGAPGTAASTTNGYAGQVAYTVRGASGQTANLQEWNVAGGAALAAILAAGTLVVPGATAGIPAFYGSDANARIFSNGSVGLQLQYNSANGGTLTFDSNGIIASGSGSATFKIRNQLLNDSGDLTINDTVAVTSLQTAGGIVYGTASTLGVSAAGTSGQCLKSGGSGAPTWGTCDGAAYLAEALWGFAGRCGIGASCVTEANFLGPYRTSVFTAFAAKSISCSWGTAGTGGTTGVVVELLDNTTPASVCTCTLGACTTSASTPLICGCAGSVGPNKTLVMRLASTTDCTANPQEIHCNVMGTAQ
ncbi:MAG: hypothetical protein ACOZIN_08545 [Myxococcota bacterium]